MYCSLAYSPPSIHLGKLGCGSFVTSNSSQLHQLARIYPLPDHPSSTPPIRLLWPQKSRRPSTSHIFASRSTPALSRCQASTSPTTTATRLFTPGAFPFPKLPAPVQQLWDVSTIMVLWYGHPEINKDNDDGPEADMISGETTDCSRYQSHQRAHSSRQGTNKIVK